MIKKEENSIRCNSIVIILYLYKIVSFILFQYFQTYCIDAQVPDSACTATSYLTGVKTKYGVVGLDGNVTRGSCDSQLHPPNWAPSIGQWALDRGLDVGQYLKICNVVPMTTSGGSFNGGRWEEGLFFYLFPTTSRESVLVILVVAITHKPISLTQIFFV